MKNGRIRQTVLDTKPIAAQMRKALGLSCASRMHVNNTEGTLAPVAAALPTSNLRMEQHRNTTRGLHHAKLRNTIMNNGVTTLPFSILQTHPVRHCSPEDEGVNSHPCGAPSNEKHRRRIRKTEVVRTSEAIILSFTATLCSVHWHVEGGYQHQADESSAEHG